MKLPIFDRLNEVRKRKEIVENMLKKQYHHIHLGKRQKQLTFSDGWIRAENLPHLVGDYRGIFIEIYEIRIELDESKFENQKTAHKTFERWANNLRKLKEYKKIELIVRSEMCDELYDVFLDAILENKEYLEELSINCSKMEFYGDEYLILLSELICNKFNGNLRAV